MVDGETREKYADEIGSVTGIQNQSLLRAFATVARENFLGAPPWRVLSPATRTPGPIQTTETNDPGDLYQNVAVVLDQARMLTNGNPGTLAPWLDSLALSEGN